MPLDPLSALSVAASVVQFIEFSVKIVSTSQQIHESSTGALRENDEVETAAKRLQELAGNLKSSSHTELPASGELCC
jgi:hypothetical protein